MPTPEGPASADERAGSRRPAKAPPEIAIRVSWCKSCGLCVDYCTRGVLVMEGTLPKVVNAEQCTRCLQCEAICPDFAIEVRDHAAESGDAGGGKP